MKKSFTKFLLLAVVAMVSGNVWGDEPTAQTIKIGFNGLCDPTIKIDNGSGTDCSTDEGVMTISNGVISVTCPVQNGKTDQDNKYRGDLTCTPSTAWTLTDNDVYLAFKLNSGSVANTDGKIHLTYEVSSKTKSVYTHVDLTGTNAGSIYYVKLSDIDASLTTGASVSYVKLKMADTNSENKTYSIDWIATLNDVPTSSTNIKDDAADFTNKVVNLTTWADYETPKAALAAVSTNNNYIVFKDNLTVGSNRIDAPTTGSNITGTVIDGQNHTLTRSQAGYGIIYTTGSAKTSDLLIKNLTIDGGSSVTPTTYAFEVNKPMTFQDVIFTNFKANSSSIYAMFNCKNSGLVFKGSVQIKSSTADFVYLNKDIRINDNGATYTNISATVRPTIFLASTYESGDLLVKNTATNSSQLATNKYLITNLGWYQGGIDSGTDMYGLKAYKVTDSYTLTVTSAGASTLILPFAASIPTTNDNSETASFKAYTLSYTSGKTATASSVTTLTANTPYYIVADEGSYTFTGAASYDKKSYTSGALTGVFCGTEVPSTSYILQTKGVDGDNNPVTGLAFYKSNNSTVAPFRCYLTADGNGAKAITIDFGEADGISQILAMQASEAGANELTNSQINSAYFNLTGQRVNANAKGIVIMNGRKYINK